LLKLLKEEKIPEPQVHGNARQWNGSDVRHAQLVLGDLRGTGELRGRAHA
jgi:hypothetical protein